jgi:hypothetical protein
MNKPPTGKRNINQELEILLPVTHSNENKNNALAEPISMEIRTQIINHLISFLNVF